MAAPAVKMFALACAVAVLAGCADTTPPWSVEVLPTPAAPGSGQANLAGGAGLPLVLSWQEPQADGATALRMARFEQGAWSVPNNVAAGAAWFVNWADFPSVIPLDQNRVVAHWLQLKPDQRYAYDIRFAVSDDSGDTWRDAGVLNGDTTVAEHGFVSFFPWGEAAGAIWLDGRNIAALTVDELFELEEPVGMALRFARFDDEGRILARGEIDALVCDCCQTDAVVTSRGPLIVYRDRTTNEIRDIAIRRVTDSGWSEPQILGPDGWQIDGCPVNGPALSAAGDAVGAAWFTAADDEPRIRFARSSDGGTTFSPAQTIAAAGSLGQVDVVMSADGTAWLSAWHRAEQGMELRVHRIAANGAVSTRTLAQTAEPLPTDVPQLALAADRLVLVWSELGGGDDPGGLHAVTAPLWEAPSE